MLGCVIGIHKINPDTERMRLLLEMPAPEDGKA